jgi:hypothetical protein
MFSMGTTGTQISMVEYDDSDGKIFLLNKI